MFGLLQRRTCSTDAATKNDYRLHYCGTCKTMGALYGQRSRMLLNFDAVFFAELLTNLSAQNTATWHESYQQQNCFALPTDEATMPAPLRYAASANVLLAELKNDDNLRDNGGVLWRGAKWILSDSYQKASATMQNFGLDIDALWQQIELQNELEKNHTTAAKSLQDYAAPTKKMTALVFAQAAKAIENEHLYANLYEVGSALGELVYFLDALEDLGKDAKNSTFNALLAFYQTKKLNAEQLVAASQTVKIAELRLAQALENLPLSLAVKEEMTARLSANLVLRTHKVVPTAASSETVTALQHAGHAISQATTFGESLKVAMYSMVVILLPQVSSAIGVGNKHNWSLAAMATAMWAAIWAGKKAKQTCTTHSNTLQNSDCCDGGCGNGCGNSGGENCCAACLSACVAACCESICHAGCDMCTQTMCGWCKGKDDSALTTLLIVLFCLALLVGVAYLIIKLGIG